MFNFTFSLLKFIEKHCRSVIKSLIKIKLALKIDFKKCDFNKSYGVKMVGKYIKHFNQIESIESFEDKINNTLFDLNGDATMVASIYPQGYQFIPIGGYSSAITLTVDPKTPSAPSEKAKYLNVGNDKGQKGYLSNINKSFRSIVYAERDSYS
jgi:hypothetical protein